jgi:CTP:molybdopterin cytidylyltransferase MocA
MAVTLHILILAAGESSRMRGVDKLLQPVAGKPLLRHIADVALATGSPVFVTLPLVSPSRNAALEGLSLCRVPVPDAAEGMSRSLARGVQALAEAGPQDGLMVLPADMPGFTTAALVGLIDRFKADPSQILRGGTPDGLAGHPTVFPRDLWPALASVTGDQGGRSVLQSNHDRVSVVPLPDQMAVLDLDTPEDWAAWRSR